MKTLKSMKLTVILVFIMSMIMAGCSSTTDSPPSNDGDASSESSTNQNSDQGETITISFANWVSAEAATAENVEKVIKAFEDKHPNVKVNNVAIPFDQMRQQLLTMTAGGNPPDVAMLSGPWSQELGSQGALIDLTDIAGADYLADNWQGGLEAGQYGDNLYAAPFSLTPHAFWYNKKIMEEAGLDPNSPPKTFGELEDQMAQINANLGDDVYAIGIDTTRIDYALVQFWPYFYAHNARPLYDGEINFDTPEVKEALEWMRHTVKEGYTPSGQQIKELRELMAQNKIAFKLDGPYFKGILQSLNPSLEGDSFYDTFGVTSVPVGANGKSETLADIHQLGISTQSQHKEMAWEFVKFLVSSDISINEYQIPLGVIPALKSTQTEDKFSDPVSIEYIDNIFDTMVGGPYGPEYGQGQQFIIQAMQEAALTDRPITDIIKSTEQTLNTLYGK